MDASRLPAYLQQIVVDERGCWVWQGSRWSKRGRPRVCIARRWVSAYRVSYEALVGPIPAGLTIDHLCGNKCCINPAHMEPVTKPENTRRYVAALYGSPPAHVTAIYASDLPSRDLAAQHGVTVTTVNRIRAGTRWGDVTKVDESGCIMLATRQFAPAVPTAAQGAARHAAIVAEMRAFEAERDRRIAEARAAGLTPARFWFADWQRERGL